MTTYLGIDTGGTFTDAVVLDHTRRVLASAKSLTTRFDLAQGIEASLDKLPPLHLARIARVCLSTTLTTNAVVEGKGSPVCVLLIGYDERQIEASGLPALLGRDSLVSVAGGHDAEGRPLAELDEHALAAAITAQAARVSAFAVSAAFSVRNPGHERRARELVTRLSGKPVTCGHELASSLGAPRRAMTAALNARMIGYVRALLDSVRAILDAREIRAPLMIVKGDGSLVSAASALHRPVGTVLSGPAASVIGACALSGLRNAIVADMGGTTTDIAVVRDGRPALACDGALIGDWKPMVEAIRVYSIGLGGDSEVRFSGGEGIAIGPRRVVPLSLLAAQYPQIEERLVHQARGNPTGSHNRFAVRLQHDEALITRLTEDERHAWAQLAHGPLEVERIALEDRRLARALARLERKGLAIYSGFTPTDAAHVLGLSDHWCVAAARHAAVVWARQMRRLYGYGTWSEGDPLAPAQAVFDCVADAITLKLVEAGLHDRDRLGDAAARRLAPLITALALEPGRSAGQRPVFDLRFADDMPVVAVGGPAPSHYPAVAAALGATLHLPSHGDVANAVGAVLGEVVQRVHLTVTQPTRGCFRMFGRDGPVDFRTLDEAIDSARALAAAEARVLADEAGAAGVTLAFERLDNAVSNDIDGNLFFESRVTAIASGPPADTLPDGATVDSTDGPSDDAAGGATAATGNAEPSGAVRDNG
ncbi:MAG: hydantoinase/oxoprolinase N-terminal domain-containing protein [Rhodocyclaceae bacterium]